MLSDPIINEVRKNREVSAAEYENNLVQVIKTLKAIEATSGRSYVVPDTKGSSDDFI